MAGVSDQSMSDGLRTALNVSLNAFFYYAVICCFLSSFSSIRKKWFLIGVCSVIAVVGIFMLV